MFKTGPRSSIALLAVAGLVAFALAPACGSQSSSSSTSSSSSSGAGGSSSGPGSSSSGSAGASSSSGSSSGNGGAGGGAPVVSECPKEKANVVSKGPGAMSADEDWTSDKVYEVVGHYGTDTHHLTIEAGTVVCFAPAMDPADGEGHLNVDAGGTLDVKGTPASHVTFTRDKDFDSAWDGIEYDGSVAKPGTLEYLDIHWCGQSGGGSCISTTANPHGAPLDLRHLTFYEHQLYGIKNLMGGFTPETTITFHDFGKVAGMDMPPSYYANAPVLRMRPETVHTISPTTITVPDAAPDPVKYVTIDNADGELLTEDIHFPKLPSKLQYAMTVNFNLAGDVGKPNTWTIDPGVRIAMGSSAEIRVGGFTSMSNVVAVGTAADPITFTSASTYTGATAPKPGDWVTMVFFKDNFDPAVTKFEYVHFEYGGGVGTATLNSCDGNMYGGYVGFLLGFGGAAPGFSIKNSVFEKSAGQAIRSDGNPPNLSTDYTAAALGNTFNGFTKPPAQYVSTCP